MLRLTAVLLAATLAFAQRENWRTPYPAHTIAGNVHYVGTEDLACYLITTPDGHILINTGLSDSVPLIRKSVSSLGFKIEELKILLTMQAHDDHIAGIGELQELTGAKVFITEADAPALAPVRVDRRLKDGDSVKLGSSELKVILTPGHTKGSVSYSMTVTDKGKPVRILFANMSTVVTALVGNKDYPGIVGDFTRTFAKQKALSADIWLAGHGSQYNMKEKHKAGSFVDPDGYLQAVQEYEKLFLEKLEQERKSSGRMQTGQK